MLGTIKNTIGWTIVGLLILVFTGGFALGAGWTAYNTWCMVSDYVRSRHWVETPARIEAVDLVVSHGSKSSTSRVTCAYRYTFNGQDYRGNRVGLVEGSDSAGSWQVATYDRLHEAYEQGDPVVCFVDADQPKVSVLDRQLRYPLLVLCTAFVLVFGIVALTLILFLPYALLVQLPRDRRFKRAHPDEPWLQKPEWAAGVIPSKLGRRTAFAWYAAIYWSLGTLPTVIFLPLGLRQPDSLSAIGTAFFVLIALILLIVAFRCTSRARRFGASRLELETNPGSVGGHFRSRLVLVGDVAALNEVEVTLKCKQRLTTRQGGRSNTEDHTLWEQTLTLQVPGTVFGQTEVVLPINFEIPASCRPTDESNSNDQVTWHIESKASIPGVDLKMAFEVPIFSAQGSPTPV